MNIVFFGSFQHYSALILKSLITNHRSLTTVSAVVTTPPAPMGRQKILTKSPVHALAYQHSIPVFTPDKLTSKTVFEVLASEKVIDFFITAGYGKILPKSWLEYPKYGSLNLHFSLLPKYRGANPAEWAIMCGETTTGISLIQMNQKLDGGDILAQAEIPIIGDACPEPSRRDTRETLYQKLYELGANTLPTWLLEWQEFAERSRTPLARLAEATAKRAGVEHRKITVRKQPSISSTPYAALLKRQDGFLPWSTIQKLLQRQSLQSTDFPSPHLQTAFKYTSEVYQNTPEDFLARLPKALAGYPSLWTIVKTNKGDKRMKILSFDSRLETSDLSLGLVQIEGQQPAAFNQIKNQIL